MSESHSKACDDSHNSTELGVSLGDAESRTYASEGDSLSEDYSYERERIAAGVFGLDPHRIDRFTITRRIGSGGQGKVYQARDPRLNRDVAIKVVARRSRVADRAYERMLQEAQALAQLDHPNIVKVFEAADHDGQLYLVMEFLDGCDLSQWSVSRSLDEIIDFVLQAARGLHAAHLKDLIHRDFKPSNVMIDNGGQVRIIDFGLVKSIGSALSESLQTGRVITLDQSGELTLDGSRLGTRQYMSPEQIENHELTPASDQFSLAICFYQALYGCRPFSANDASTVKETFSAGKWPSQGPSRRVPRWLDRIVKRGLSPERRDRYPDLAAFVQAIERRWKLGSRVAKKALWSVGGLSLGITLASTTPLWPDPCLEEGAVVRELKTARPESAALNGEFHRSLGRYVDELASESESACRLPESTSAEQDYKSARRRCVEGLSDEYIAYMGELKNKGGKRPITTAIYLQAMGGYEGVDALRPPQVCKSSKADLEAQRLAPEASEHKQIYRDTVNLRAATNIADFRLEDADDLVKRARKSEVPALLAEALYERGRIEYFSRYGAKAYQDFLEATHAAQESGLSSMLVDCYIFVAMSALVSDGRLDLASQRLHDAEALLKGMSNSAKGMRLANVYLLEGRIAKVLGDAELAEARFEEAKGEYAKGDGLSREITRELVNVNLAGIRRGQGRLLEADELILGLQEKFGEDDLPNLAWGNIYLTQARTARARLAGIPEGSAREPVYLKALDSLQRARLYFGRSFGDISVWAGEVEYELGRLTYDFDSKNQSEALRHMQEAYNLYQQIPSDLRPRRKLGEVLAWMSMLKLPADENEWPENESLVDEVLPDLERAIEVLAGSTGDRALSDQLIWLHKVKAILLMSHGLDTESVEAYDEAIAVALRSDRSMEYKRLRDVRDSLIESLQ